LKLLAGTARPDRDKPGEADLPVIDQVPEAPEWLPNGHAVREFEKLAAFLHANKILTEASVVPLAHLAAIHGKLVQGYAAGITPSGHLLSQYRALCGDFGLTPANAHKVRANGDAGRRNPFARNGKR
tara:strand:- start:4393 stop:4773 length:381 start_codon:yes stop_codon:yes gene_type:complete